MTHAVIFDEAHRAARLKLIPTMVKECRKYGIAFVVASQEAKDFDPSLFTAVANYLALRLSEGTHRAPTEPRQPLGPGTRCVRYCDRTFIMDRASLSLS